MVLAAAPMVTVHLSGLTAVVVQPADQPPNTEPGFGVAVIVTSVPCA